MNAAWTRLPTHRAWLDAELRRLLDFGSAVVHPEGGAAYLDERGRPALDKPVHTWITARTVHVFGLGTLLGVPGSADRARGALAGLTGRLRDAEHGGWFHAVDATGTPDIAAGKSCYDHAFVVLAASTAAIAGLPGGRALLHEATTVLEERFWDEDAGRCVDLWDVAWAELDGYRGLNANMHAVEAMLAAADALGGEDGDRWRERAARVAVFVTELATAHDDRLPEHFDAGWTAVPDLNRDRPDDQFKPFGATPGHGFEWARLLVQLDAALGDRAPDGLVPAAARLFDRAAADSWAVDGADGFVYTTDWGGEPVVRDRMHWVAAEAVAAADALHRATGEQRFAEQYKPWWDFIATRLIDREQGSWHHQLDPTNCPDGGVWPGKPDLYHAVQATLLPRAPLTPTLARAAADGSVTA